MASSRAYKPYRIDPEVFARETSPEAEAAKRAREEAEFGHLLAQLRGGAIIRLSPRREPPIPPE
jgi:hypothetical protein